MSGFEQTSTTAGPGGSQSAYFPTGGGEAGALIRAQSWSSTPVGSPEAWPVALKTLIGVMLGSSQPMFVSWGVNRTLLYNDAYSEILASKHPAAMGQDFLEVWQEIRSELVPIVEQAYRGEPVQMDDIELWIERKGFQEEAHFAFSYTPVQGESGDIEGFFCVCQEITDQVTAERRLRESEARARADAERVSLTLAAGAIIGTWFWDLPSDRFTVDEQFANAFGINPALGRSGLSLEQVIATVHPDDKAGLIAAIEEAIGRGGPYAHQYRVRRADGNYYWIEANGRVDKDADGTPLSFPGVLLDVEERRRTEAALRASEEFGRRVLASSPDCIKILSLDGRLEYMTEGGMCVMEVDDFGDIKDACWPEVWQGEERPKAVKAVEEARNGGTARFQGFAETLKGTPRWWDVTVSPISGADGHPEKLLSVSRDITPIKEAEIVLRESEERLRQTSRRLDAILANTQMAVFLMDHRQHCVFANPAAEALTGYSLDQMQGRRLHDVIHHKKPDGSHYPLEECPIDQAFPERAQMSGEELFVHSDGSFYPVEFTASPVLDEEGSPIGTVIEARNIAEKKARENALRESEARLRELNETLELQVAERTADRDRTWRLSQDLLAVVERDGTFAAVNAAWQTLLGWSEQDLLGSHFVEFTHPDDLEATLAVFADVFDAPLTTPYEYRFRHRDGSYRWFAWTAAFEGGRVYAIGRHTTAEREQAEALRGAEEQLRQSQKMEAVGQLTGGIAHDFNNLLTGVIGSLDMMQRRIAKGETDKIARYATTAMTAANRAAALTHRLLAFSRRQPLDPKPVNANRLVTGMEELLRRTIGESIRLEIVTAGGLWQTLCDPHQLESAILNLAINARDAMADGGTLTIETCNAHLDNAYAARSRDVRPGQYICICVTDTGAGMTPDVIAKAFDPFFTTKPIGQGTGLGLSMIYGFARQSEGYARIYSEVGKGTSVKLYLPRYYGEGEDAEDASSDLIEEHRSDLGEVVLVIEDETAVRELVVEVLEDLGYRALQAADGLSGLKLLQSDARIDLLVTDVGLPGLNGRQLADHAREQRPGLRVLFMTGYAENATIANGFLEPGMQMITKPFAIEMLATRIRDMIEAGAEDSLSGGGKHDGSV